MYLAFLQAQKYIVKMHELLVFSEHLILFSDQKVLPVPCSCSDQGN